jgi:hypothetical protein
VTFSSSQESKTEFAVMLTNKTMSEAPPSIATPSEKAVYEQAAAAAAPAAAAPAGAAAGDEPKGPSKSELKKRAKEEEKRKKAEEREKREKEEREKKAKADSEVSAGLRFLQLGLLVPRWVTAVMRELGTRRSRASVSLPASDYRACNELFSLSSCSF